VFFAARERLNIGPNSMKWFADDGKRQARRALMTAGPAADASS
jgi:hypothetical protein